MITIYTENRSARLEYVCNQIFSHILGIEYEICKIGMQNINNNIKIYYSDSVEKEAINIKPYGLLEEKGVKTLEPN